MGSFLIRPRSCERLKVAGVSRDEDPAIRRCELEDELVGEGATGRIRLQGENVVPVPLEWRGDPTA